MYNILRELKESAKLIESLDAHKIEEIAYLLVDVVVRNRHKVIFFGNGGSMADAQHLAAELLGKFEKERIPLSSMALDNIASISAIGNDYGFENVFARQLEGLVESGDVVIAISTSGNSENILKGIKSANKKGALVVAFTKKDSKLDKAAYFSLSIPSSRTCKIQEAYMVAGHIICGIVEHEISNVERKP